MVMKVRKLFTAGIIVTMLFGSTLNVFAAEPAEKLVDTLKKNNQESLILDVKAYKAAYSDLAAVYGDDWDAYLEHYLTHGIYEKRTKGALFDPLTYAASYSDVQAAYGDNILKIVNHYVIHGVKENRAEGTAVGYADLAAAEQSGAVKLVPRSNSAKVNNSVNNMKKATLGNMTDGMNVAIASEAMSPEAAAAGDSNSLAVVSMENAAAIVNGSAVANGSVAGNTNKNSQNYHHTTEIYANDNSTLIRVEYYDENNNMFQYSDVKDYDSNTHSYTEEVYSYDKENDVETLERTDTYVNGELSSTQ